MYLSTRGSPGAEASRAHPARFGGSSVFHGGSCHLLGVGGVKKCWSCDSGAAEGSRQDMVAPPSPCSGSYKEQVGGTLAWRRVPVWSWWGLRGSHSDWGASRA